MNRYFSGGRRLILSYGITNPIAQSPTFDRKRAKIQEKKAIIISRQIDIILSLSIKGLFLFIRK